MRLLAIATVFLAASPFVQAQDAASTPFQHRSPSPTEESATPTPTSKPRATPTPEPTETFTLQPMVTPTLEPIPTPTLEPIASPLPKPTATIASPTPKPIAIPTPRPTATPRPKPTATPKPRPTPTPKPKPTATPTSEPTPIPAESPAVDQDQSDIASKLKALEEHWEGSFVTHDISVIEQLVAEDFVGTSSSGKLGNKSTMISEARKDKNVYTSAVSGDMTVRSFGPNVAVVTGIAREAGKTPAGKAFSHGYRFTDTWVERNGEWQCVAAHAMVLPKK